MGGEFRSGPAAGTASIAGVTFARKNLQYAEVDGLAIFEGDIILGTIEEMRAADAGPIMASIGITGQQFRWPNATVPFEIDPALPNPQRVTDAIAHWEAHTRIRFVPRGTHTDFVRFQPGGGCSSSVGRRGGQQTVTLGNGCSTGNAIHEIGHTVGLWHEQSREDRDSFVRIVWANIDPAMQHNFVQQIADGDDLGPYDYGSIMHYPATAFSINGQPTIIALQPLPPGVVMGQRNGLSQGDINGVHMMYPLPTFKEVPKDPIRDTIKEVRKDPIRDTIKEVRKDPIQDTIKEVPKDPIRDTIKEVRKDPIHETVKEIRKDPIQDTIKESAKDPIVDPTIKEGGFDPGPFPPGPQPGPFGSPGDMGMGSASPFVLATPNRAGSAMGGNMGGGMDAFAAASEQVQQLAEAIAQLEQQHEELVAAYEAAVQALNDLQQGG
jgi:hypothetical protein